MSALVYERPQSSGVDEMGLCCFHSVNMRDMLWRQMQRCRGYDIYYYMRIVVVQ